MSLLLLVLAELTASSAPNAAEPERNRGLWVGSTQLCSDTVTSAIAGEEPGGLYGVEFLVTLATQAVVRRETEALVGQPWPIRLNGRIVLEPVLREPLTGGLSVVPIDPEIARALRDAALGPC